MDQGENPSLKIHCSHSSLPSATKLPDLPPPAPPEQNDIIFLCLYSTHHKCYYSQPDPLVLRIAKKTRDVWDNQTADAAEMN